MKINAVNILALIMAAFGLLTLFVSASVIFDLFGIREKEGNYVAFVVWANFICSWLYLAAAYAVAKLKKWGYILPAIALLVLALAFIGLFVHIYSGGLYESKTIAAMAFRTLLTFALTLFAYLSIKKNYNHEKS